MLTQMATPLLLIPLLLQLLLLISPNLAATNSHYNSNGLVINEDDELVEGLINCLQEKQSNPKYPITEFIYTHQNSSFLTILNARANNLRYQKPDTWKPLMIIAPKEESTVPAVIQCARVHGLKLRIRSGGHDFEGLSYTAPRGVRFVLLDMFNLDDVSIDIIEETGWIQTGATLGQIYYRIAEKSGVHAFPAGVCPSVGSGGHISGGGYGALMRMYGLTVDNVVDARIVDATGKVMDRAAMGEDLFWAIRGGGGSSFGVILAWKIKLVRVPPLVTVFNVDKDVLNTPGANHLLYKWQEVAHKLPKELFLRIESTAMSLPNINVTTSSFLAMFLGDKESLLRIMGESFPELGLKGEDCKEMPWIDSVLFWQHIPEGTPRETLLDYDSNRGHALYRKIKGDFVKRPIPEAVLTKIWDKMMDMGFLYMEWSPYGGRMDEIDEFALPFPHRKENLYMIFYDIMWYDDDESSEKLERKFKEFYDFMEPYVSNSPRESVLNYIDLDLEDSGNKYFKDNFLKLVTVKTKVDPTDFFSHEQSIPALYKLWENRKFGTSYGTNLDLPM